MVGTNLSKMSKRKGKANAKQKSRPKAKAEEVEAEPSVDQKGERAKATGDLNKVTDYVEEREMDANKMADSMRAILGNASSSKKGKDSLVTGVKIREADVELIMNEMDIDSKLAEKALRNSRGDVVQALCNLVH